MADIFKDEYKGSMDSKYYFSAERVGATASPQVPNQIGELTSRLNQGLKAVELGALNQRLLDQIPKEHFDEARRLNELTGAKASLHAPIQDMDLAGFTQQGWNKYEQLTNIEKLKSTLDRAQKLDSKGNTPVVVHAGGMMAQRWQKTGLKTEEGTPIEDARSEMAVVNQDSGQVQLLRYKEKEYFGGKKIVWTPERYMNNLNENEWDREKLQLMQWKKDMHEVEDRLGANIARTNLLALQQAEEQEKKLGKKILTEKERQQLENIRKEQEDSFKYGEETYRSMRSLMEDMNERFQKFSPKEGEEAKRYNYFKETTQKEMNKKFEEGEKEIEERRKIAGKSFREAEKTKSPEAIEKLAKAEQNFYITLNKQTDTMARYVQEMPAPKTWTSVDDFSKEKVSESVSEAAFASFKKYGENSPLVLLENVYPEMALSRADALKSTVEESRKRFAEKLVKENKISKKKAEETAEKLIGVTWDVGHIYQLKKYGYSDEDILKEAKKIAPYVKHAHLSDNFGFEDAHLPPGLGESNIKEQLKELEKAGFKGRGIVEAGEFVANFKEVPHLYALSHLSSPLYVEKVEPYWQQIWDTQGVYFSGFGELLPQKYFDLYGAPGFSQLPVSLGGTARAPERGRFAAGGEEQEAT